MHLPPSKNWYSPAKIAIAPTRPESIYTIAHSNQLLNSTAIYKSTDAGIHWQVTGGPSPGFPEWAAGIPPTRLSLIRSIRRLVYLVIGGVVIKTTDGGDHWKQITNGLPPGDASSRLSGLPEDGNVTSLAADPQHPGALYAGLQRGPEKGAIYKTTDGGKLLDAPCRNRWSHRCRRDQSRPPRDNLGCWLGGRHRPKRVGDLAAPDLQKHRRRSHLGQRTVTPAPAPPGRRLRSIVRLLVAATVLAGLGGVAVVAAAQGQAAGSQPSGTIAFLAIPRVR